MAKTRPRRPRRGCSCASGRRSRRSRARGSCGALLPGARVPNPVALHSGTSSTGAPAGGAVARRGTGTETRRRRRVRTRRDAPTRVPSRDARGRRARARRRVSRRGRRRAKRECARRRRTRRTCRRLRRTASGRRRECALGATFRGVRATSSVHVTAVSAQRVDNNLETLALRRSSRTRCTGATTFAAALVLFSGSLLPSRRSDGAIMGKDKAKRAAGASSARAAAGGFAAAPRSPGARALPHDLTSASSPTPLSTVGGCPPPRAPSRPPRAPEF